MSFFSGDNIIEVHNSLWSGRETIYYNGEQVSSKRSIFGATHKFTVEEDGVPVDYKVILELRWFGIGFNIYRDGDPFVLAF